MTKVNAIVFETFLNIRTFDVLYKCTLSVESRNVLCTFKMYSIVYSKMYSITLREFLYSGITDLVKMRTFQLIHLQFLNVHLLRITNYPKKITLKLQKQITKTNYKISNSDAFGRKESLLASSHLNCQLSSCRPEMCRVTVVNCNKILG
jgi:hypothetical protein